MEKTDLSSRVDATAAGSTQIRQRLAGGERQTFDRWFVIVLTLYIFAAASAVVMAIWGVRDAIGYLASAFVLGSFASRAMMPLRILAAFSNVAFIVYAAECQLPPVLVLHALLLPVNLFRIAQLTGAVAAASSFLGERFAVPPRSFMPEGALATPITKSRAR